jgi:hypothetical protein
MRRISSIVASLLFICNPVYATEVTLDTAYSQDYYQGETVIGRSAKLNISGNKGKFDYRLYRAYGKSGGIKTKDNGGVGLGWDPILSKKWSAWIDAEWGFNHALNIDSEIFLGGGPKYVFYEKEDKKISLSFGALYQERNPGDYSESRWSLRPKIKWGKWKGVFFYQPNMVDSDDYILKADVSGRISEITAFFTNYEKRAIDNSEVIMSGLRFIIKNK